MLYKASTILASLMVSVFFLVSCSSQKTVYITNKLDKAITLSVNDSIKTDQSTTLAFKDSLNNRRIEPGRLVIHFGEGKWKKEDQISLKNMLLRTKLSVDGDSITYRFPTTLRVQYIRLMVEELYIKITEVK